ncbi:hypothetical protein [Mucilaginibacter gilvus]|uniref:Uncharacterized protein n=1 Tax=Mucilaginibacter gilvus TaxID=2305909 RepID=A0A444MHW3_9SPHI|nr:hypothetical protein [Mucilaginibacter gilvus]RWY47252.1 hypothetical protein EPL05_22465 [Mucilaginibacter gilvus]
MSNQLETVWYLPSENTWKQFQYLAMKDIGTIAFFKDVISFTGEKTDIKIAQIISISYGKQGRDFINNWIKIDYHDETGVQSQAFFADGNNRGWSGIFGGTKKMYMLIKELYNV